MSGRVGQRVRWGLSLVEAIVAIFILSFSLLSVIQLLNVGIDIDGRSERYRIATLIARRHLADLRLWARTPANFFGSWASQNTTLQDTQFPDYQVTIAVANQTMPSPCSQLEAPFGPPTTTPDARRLIHSCYYTVSVNVSWNPGHAPSTVQIGSLIGAPSQPVASVSTDPAPAGSVAIDGCYTVNAVARDAGGNAIPDIFFTWTQTPTTTRGSAGSFTGNTTRDGLTAQFQNYYCTQNINGTPTRIYGGNGNVTIEPQVRAGNPSVTSQVVELQ